MQNIYQKIFHWYNRNSRELPWRLHSDPYVIWLSEIILQQTQIQQGKPYFFRFIEAFPDVFSLAHADEKKIMRMWEGLGYYNRARNMLKTARIIAFDHNGRFPENYEGLLQLPGIGSYTAAAIASIAYGEKKIALDGNLKRVFSRLYGVYEEINSPAALTQFHTIGDELLQDDVDPSLLNQALMDLGATVCTPTSPACSTCPIYQHCYALENDKIGELPYKKKAKAKKVRKMTYLLLRREDQIFLQARSREDIWPALFEFYLVEDREPIHKYDPRKAKLVLQKKHILTHQILDISVYDYTGHIIDLPESGWKKLQDIDQYALPAAFKSLKESLIHSQN